MFPILNKSNQEGRVFLTEYESKGILKEFGIPVVETRLAKDREEAVSFSKRLGFPVVLKIASPDIIHKSDSGGVKLDLKNPDEVKKAYNEMMRNIRRRYPKATLQGVTVQKMVKPGIEVIVGTSKDPQFGPVIMFGLGGIFVEVLKDISFRIIPVERRDALEMIQEIKGYPLLQGYRDKEPVKISNLVNLLLKISKLMERNPEIEELELNPVFVYKDSLMAVDARMVMANPEIMSSIFAKEQKRLRMA
ncbi:MAG: acetate--CoA ligase family protein [Thermodesulfobacteriota bacterium]